MSTKAKEVKKDEEAKKVSGKAKVVLLCSYGDKKPNTTVSLPQAEAEMLIAKGWATKD